MINVQPHITKLEVLKKYMAVKIEHIAGKIGFVNKTKHMFFDPSIYFPYFPDFDEWYSIYCSANN